jgi:electron transfer flavoprotein alpha subunit
MEVTDRMLVSNAEIVDIELKPEDIDISEAEVIVQCGRGVKSKTDLAMVQEFADLLGARMACTRPLVENNWFDAKHQIGLSGRTVKPKLLICIGVSGAVQTVAGMKGSDLIIAINSDPQAPIFDVAHYGYVGDLYEIVPMLIEKIKKTRGEV